MFREGVLATNRNMQLKIQVLHDMTITSLKNITFFLGRLPCFLQGMSERPAVVMGLMCIVSLMMQFI